jgi:hypothetical protein
MYEFEFECEIQVWYFIKCFVVLKDDIFETSLCYLSQKKIVAPGGLWMHLYENLMPLKLAADTSRLYLFDIASNIAKKSNFEPFRIWNC